MEKSRWVKEFPGSVIVCDPEGVILEMNDQAIRGIKGRCDRDLVGTSVFDCHNAVSQEKLRHLMKHRLTNIYVSEKKGVKKLIYQTPWYVDGVYGGFMEMALPLPDSIPLRLRT